MRGTRVPVQHCCTPETPKLANLPRPRTFAQGQGQGLDLQGQGQGQRLKICPRGHLKAKDQRQGQQHWKAGDALTYIGLYSLHADHVPSPGEDIPHVFHCTFARRDIPRKTINSTCERRVKKHARCPLPGSNGKSYEIVACGCGPINTQPLRSFTVNESSNQAISLLGNKGQKATYKSQNTIYNDYSPRQYIQHIKKSCVGKAVYKLRKWMKFNEKSTVEMTGKRIWHSHSRTATSHIPSHPQVEVFFPFQWSYFITYYTLSLSI